VSVECPCAFDNVTCALHNNAAQAVRHEDDWPLARLPQLSFCLVSSLSTLYIRDLPLQARVAISQSVSCQFIFAVQTVSLEVVN
jgi:hypothetical protein